MKRSLLSLMLLCFAVFGVARAQETLTVHDGTATNGYVPVYGYYADAYLKCEMVYPAAELGDMDGGTITGMTFYASTPATDSWGSANFQVFLTEVADATISAYVGPGTVVYEGALDGTQSKMTITFTTPYVYNGGNLLVGVYNTVTGSYKSITWAGENVTGASITGYSYSSLDAVSASQRNFLPKTTFGYTPGEVVGCGKPKQLAVNYTGGTTATVTWTGDATLYNIDVNGTVTNNVTSPYTLTDLEFGTTYAVKVQANCDGDLSDFTSAVNFTTDLCMPEDQCALTFVVTDSYGDGWNDASIDIYDYTGEALGDLLASVANTSDAGAGEAQTYTLNFCNGQELAIIWTSGSYDSECSYTITDINGDVVAQDDMELAIAYTINCTETDCRKPTDFVASEIGPRSVVLSWTENGPATSWVIAYLSENDEDITEITVNTNPYTLTGLTPETKYAAQVTPVCDVDKPSEVITWTTDVACPNPTNLSVTAYPNSANLTWNGFADAYDLEWALMPASGSKDPYNDGNWYYYDNGTYEGSVGLGGGEFHWGVMFPAGTYEGSLVSKVKAYDISAMVGTLAIYNDGETAPANQISIQDVEFTGAGDWVEFETYAIIDPSKNVWIVFDAVDGAAYPIGTSADDNGDANGRWVEINGTWYDMANVGVTGRANMLRAYIEEGFDPSTLVWNPVSGVTSPYTLEGLQPETTYIVRVKAVCGGDDGESGWTTVTFTTPSACDMPNTFSAEVEATSATLSWVGYQESFNLRYRHTEVADPTAPATIILEAHNVWGEDDQSGYQMLLDADATAYGTIIPETGGLTSSGDASAETYAEFEYKIPVNADGALTTENIVFDGRVTIQIPAGTYDWCITNPTPGDRMWIASGNGNVNGRQDDFVFEPGVTYEFVVSMHGSNDGVDMTIDRTMSDWIEVTVNEVPYTLTGLTPETYYEWQIQGVNDECHEFEWSEIQNFTTLEQTNLTQTINLIAGSNWFSTYLEITLEDLQNALAEATPNKNITIKSPGGNSSYIPRTHTWRTNNNFTWDVAKMYYIVMEEACEITLEGMPINPADHPITIVGNGASNWIGFPFSESMTLTEAFAALPPTNNDNVKSPGGNAGYSRGSWRGGFSSLEPGHGYLYVSAPNSADRTLTYPSSTSKSAQRSVNPALQLNKVAKVSDKNAKRSVNSTLELKEVKKVSVKGSIKTAFNSMINRKK